MVTWTLVIIYLVRVGPGDILERVPMATIPGFVTEEACENAYYGLLDLNAEGFRCVKVRGPRPANPTAAACLPPPPTTTLGIGDTVYHYTP